MRKDEKIVVDLSTLPDIALMSRGLNLHPERWWAPLLPPALANKGRGKGEKNVPLKVENHQETLMELLDRRMMEREAERPEFRAHRDDATASVTRLLSYRAHDDGVDMIVAGMREIQNANKDTEISIYTHGLRNENVAGLLTLHMEPNPCLQAGSLAIGQLPPLSPAKVTLAADQVIMQFPLEQRQRIVTEYRRRLVSAYAKIVSGSLVLERRHCLVGFQDDQSGNERFMNDIFDDNHEPLVWGWFMKAYIELMMSQSDWGLWAEVICKLDWKRALYASLAAVKLTFLTENGKSTCNTSYPIVVDHWGIKVLYKPEFG